MSWNLQFVDWLTCLKRKVQYIFILIKVQKTAHILPWTCCINSHELKALQIKNNTNSYCFDIWFCDGKFQTINTKNPTTVSIHLLVWIYAPPPPPHIHELLLIWQSWLFWGKNCIIEFISPYCWKARVSSRYLMDIFKKPLFNSSYYIIIEMRRTAEWEGHQSHWIPQIMFSELEL